MHTWHRVLLFLMMLWLPIQSVVAVAMPMCQARHERPPVHAHHTDLAGASHHTGGGAAHHHNARGSGLGDTHLASGSTFDGTHPASGSTFDGTRPAGGSASGDTHPAGASAHAGHGVPHDCSGCGACHLACAPMLGVRGFDFADGFSAPLIARAQAMPPRRALEQPHPPPLA